MGEIMKNIKFKKYLGPKRRYPNRRRKKHKLKDNKVVV